MPGRCWRANNRAQLWVWEADCKRVNIYLREFQKEGNVFHLVVKSFRKLFIFPRKTFSLNSKQLFFSQLLFIEEGRVSALPFFIRAPQNVNHGSRLGSGSHFSEGRQKKGGVVRLCWAAVPAAGEKWAERSCLLLPTCWRCVICNELIRAEGWLPKNQRLKPTDAPLQELAQQSWTENEHLLLLVHSYFFHLDTLYVRQMSLVGPSHMWSLCSK